MAVEIDLEFKDYYQEELYMTADVETGVLYNRSGRRMLALTDDFLIGLHRALEKECGDEAAAVIHACGRKWGRKFGEGLTAEWSEFYGHSFREFPLALFQSLLIQEFAHNGWGILDLHYEHFDKGVVWLSLRGAIMAAIRQDAGDSMTDILTAGILGGMYSYFLNREVDCLQSQSEASGCEESRFVISGKERIEQVRGKIDASTGHDQIVDLLIDAK
jgi:predicted hydrocarbon binding protein